MTVDDRKDRDNIVAGLPSIPQYLRESLYQVSDIIYPTGILEQAPKKNETSTSIFRRYLQTHSNSAYFNKLLSYQ